MHLQSIIIERKPATIETIDWHQLISIPALVEILVATNHPDRLLVSPVDGKYGVGDIDRIIEWQKLKPFSSEFKATVIEYAELLNAESQNRLLKTLEEPYANSQIILITSNQHKLLDTVLSRCITFTVTDSAGLLNPILIDSFLAGNLIQRLELAETIAAEDNGAELTANILGSVFSRMLIQPSKIGYQDLLTLYTHFRKNKYNLRLTLECLAIMLE